MICIRLTGRACHATDCRRGTLDSGAAKRTRLADHVPPDGDMSCQPARAPVPRRSVPMAEEDPDRRHCAELLKILREARGVSRAEFGALCGYSAATIKSFETGQRAIYAYHARHFDDAFGLDGIFEHEVKRFGKAGYSAAYGAFFDAEQEADDLYSFEHSLILGLFRTERYARAITENYPKVTKEIVDERVAGRLARR